MVDVVLVLLVIMMVSATYIVSQSLKVELPKTATADDSTPSLANGDGDQGPACSSTTTSRSTSPSWRAAWSPPTRANNNVNLVISADKDASHGDVVHVIDLSKLAGITKFALSIERK